MIRGSPRHVVLQSCSDNVGNSFFIVISHTFLFLVLLLELLSLLSHLIKLLHLLVELVGGDVTSLAKLLDIPGVLGNVDSWQSLRLLLLEALVLGHNCVFKV